ncbi:DUF4180 domain-containing protein [Mollicutes bacterium LVI A0039]|nr:DUF4180 domain-containing protein [Mollicutes bacterium LVI A0039]
MKKFRLKGSKVVDLTENKIKFANLELLIEYLMSYRFEQKSEIFIIDQQILPNETFAKGSDMKAELLQMCINYNAILIIVGDFNVGADAELNDFVYACNNGKRMFLVEDQQQGLELLRGIL